MSRDRVSFFPQSAGECYEVLIRTSSEWKQSDLPAILPISIHSGFMDKPFSVDCIIALYRVVRKYLSSATLLLCERSHIYVRSLDHNDMQSALAQVDKDAFIVKKAIQQIDDEIAVVDWQHFVDQSPHHGYWSEKVNILFETDKDFKSHLIADASASYTSSRQAQYPNESQFMSLAIKDYLAHCVFILLAIEKGYFYLFYMGPLPRRIQHLVAHFFATGDISHTLQWINSTIHTPRCVDNKKENN